MRPLIPDRRHQRFSEWRYLGQDSKGKYPLPSIQVMVIVVAVARNIRLPLRPAKVLAFLSPEPCFVFGGYKIRRASRLQ